MSRFIYRLLIRLHPRVFRERFGDEMICVFDETGQASAAGWLVDGCASLARQWLLRSGLWRWAVGAGVTALLILSCAHSEANFARKLAVAQALVEAKPARPLDKAEFNREAARAVAMLAHYREVDKKRSRHVYPQAVSSNQTSQD